MPRDGVNNETTVLLNWLKTMPFKIKHGEVLSEDYVHWLPRFKRYMESCLENATDNFIINEKLVEGYT